LDLQTVSGSIAFCDADVMDYGNAVFDRLDDFASLPDQQWPWVARKCSLHAFLK